MKYFGVGGVFSGLVFVELEMSVGASGVMYSLKRCGSMSPKSGLMDTRRRVCSLLDCWDIFSSFGDGAIGSGWG